jgi:hypothetical protein
MEIKLKLRRYVLLVRTEIKFYAKQYARLYTNKTYGTRKNVTYILRREK